MSSKKITKSRKKTKSEIQAVIFAGNWSTKDSKKWLKDNKLKTIGKVVLPKKGKSKKYIIQPESKFKNTAFKPVGKGITLILGFT